MAGTSLTLVTKFNRLPQIAADIKSQGEALVQQTADNVVKGAQDRAPVDTGRLRDGIHREGGGMEATVVSEAPYSVFQEYGTSRMGAHPFFWPALEAERPIYLAAWRSILAGSGQRAGSATVTPGRAKIARLKAGSR